MQIEISWSEFKDFITSTKVSWIYITEEDGSYSLFAVYESFSIKCYLRSSNTADISDFETNYKPSGNSILKPRSPVSNRPEVVLMEPEGESESISSHNFMDKTTWFYRSERVTAETQPFSLALHMPWRTQTLLIVIMGRLLSRMKKSRPMV